MTRYVLDFYASAFVDIPEGMSVDEYVDANWESVTQKATRYMLDRGEYEAYKLDFKED